MQIITIPVDGNTDVHRATCRDISQYHGLTYDDCGHFTADTKTEVAAHESAKGELHYFPCTRKLRK